ncbi:D-aminoacylase [Candidatus Bipolaricaulota bacterium]|nr:D-aminoacylase [Candidatus Bipolaricaulota bacterium]
MQKANREFDLLIKNAKIIDGTGNPWFKGDVGISGESIEEIGQLDSLTAKDTIDIGEKIVAPGFVDIHGHSDLSILADPLCKSKVHQGVTTEVIGNCGSSGFPIRESRLEELKKMYSFLGDSDLVWDWRSPKEYFRKVESQGISMNIAPLIGHGTVRIAAMGFDNRSPDKEEKEDMKKMVKEAMEAGAFGLSSGLIYPPGSYSSTQELTDLAGVVSEYGGIYSSHIRGESDDVLNAFKEAIEIGEKGDLGVQISHHKIAGKQNWGKSGESLRTIMDARARGVEVTSDQYPYTAGSTGLSSLLPDWAHEGGTDRLLDRLKNRDTREEIKKDIKEDRLEEWWNPLQSSGWDNVMVVGINSEGNEQFEGKTLAEIAEKRNEGNYETLFNLLVEEEAGARMILFMMDPEDVTSIMKHQTTMVGTDGRALSPEGALAEGKTHPRAYGTYPRILGKYVREENVLSLEEAVRKMTSFPANKLGLGERGLLKEGYKADIVIFDPETVIDKSTYQDPHRLPEGISHVLVNGRLIIKESKHTEKKSGEVIRKS